MILFKVINYFVNNIVFLVLKIFIDIILARSVKKAMEQKEKLSTNKNNQEKNQTVLRTNLMVILNCLMLVFFRLVDLSLIIVDFDRSDMTKQYNFCLYYDDWDFCSIFIKFGDLCYILSNFFNFFIYLGFNRKFRECFNSIFSKNERNKGWPLYHCTWPSCYILLYLTSFCFFYTICWRHWRCFADSSFRALGLQWCMLNIIGVVLQVYLWRVDVVYVYDDE